MSKENNITYKMIVPGAIVIILTFIGYFFSHDVIEQIEKNSSNQIAFRSEMRKDREKDKELAYKQEEKITILDTQIQLIHQDRKYMEQKFNRVYAHMEKIEEVVHVISRDIRSGKFVGHRQVFTKNVKNTQSGIV